MMHPLLLKLFPERCVEQRSQQGMAGDGPMHGFDRLHQAMVGGLPYFPNQLPPPPQPHFSMRANDRQVMELQQIFAKKSEHYGHGDRGQENAKDYRSHKGAFFRKPFPYQQHEPPVNTNRSKHIIKEIAEIVTSAPQKEEKHSTVLAETRVDGGAKVISCVDVEGTKRVRIEYDRKSMLEASQSPFARIAPTCMRDIVMKIPEIVPKFPRAFNAKEYEEKVCH